MFAKADSIERDRAAADATDVRKDVPAQASWLLCRAGTQLCAIPIEHVIETMQVLPIDVVSGAPRYVRGLCIIRGATVPVVDPGLLFGDQETRTGRLIAIRNGGGTIALAVEAVLGIRAIAAEILNQMPPLLRDTAPDTIAAIGVLDAKLLFFLRTARIVPEDLLARLVNGEALP